MAGQETVHPTKELQESKKKPGFRHILKDIVEFKGWEFLFKVLMYGFVAWGLYNLTIIYRFHNDESYAHLPKFSIYDFKYSLLFACCFFFYKLACEFIFFDMIKRNLNPEKFPTEEEKNERAKKACKWVMSIIYYTASTISAYFLFKDEFFFPPMLLGSGQCSALFKYTPYAPNIPNATWFYMIQFGCHLHTLVDHVVFKWKDPKFWEMFLHHGMAVFLIFFSYMTNEVAVGILVLFTHDPGDIFLDIVRFYNDLKNRNDVITGTFYAMFMFVWVYFRLYSFPCCIVKEAFNKLNSKTAEEWGYFYSPYMYLFMMLSALVLLHVYWFFFIVRIAINIVTKKKEYNIYDRKKN